MLKGKESKSSMASRAAAGPHRLDWIPFAGSCGTTICVPLLWQLLHLRYTPWQLQLSVPRALGTLLGCECHPELCRSPLHTGAHFPWGAGKAPGA